MRPLTLLALASVDTYLGRDYGVQDIVADGVAEGLLEHRGYRPGDVLGVTLTEEGLRRLASASFRDVGGPDESWDRLWAYLLAHGSTKEGQYSGMRPDARVHLAECGLDAAASSTPTDDAWTEFADTFHEDEKHSGMSGKATCRCGLVRDKVLYAEYPEFSLAAMIRAATGDWQSFVEGTTRGR